MITLSYFNENGLAMSRLDLELFAHSPFQGYCVCLINMYIQITVRNLEG